MGPTSSILFSLTSITLTVYSILETSPLTVTLVSLRDTVLMITDCHLLLETTGVTITRYTKNPRACSRVTACQLTMTTVPSLERSAVNTTTTVGPVK